MPRAKISYQRDPSIWLGSMPAKLTEKQRAELAAFCPHEPEIFASEVARIAGEYRAGLEVAQQVATKSEALATLRDFSRRIEALRKTISGLHGRRGAFHRQHLAENTRDFVIAASALPGRACSALWSRGADIDAWRNPLKQLHSQALYSIDDVDAEHWKAKLQELNAQAQRTIDAFPWHDLNPDPKERIESRERHRGAPNLNCWTALQLVELFQRLNMRCNFTEGRKAKFEVVECLRMVIVCGGGSALELRTAADYIQYAMSFKKKLRKAAANQPE